MATANDIMSLAASFIGTHEDPPGSNNVIFNTDYYGGPVYDPALAWCCAFVWDIYRMADASELFYDGGKTAYCPNVASWAERTGRVLPYDQARYGDLVLFDWDHDGVADHIGFVVGLNADGSLETIEGNTSDADHSNGGYVLGRKRYPDSVLMIVRIVYDEEKKIMFEFKEIKKGDSGKDVKAMQAVLRGRGYIDREKKKEDPKSKGYIEIDGSWGDSTQRAFEYFQQKVKLDVIDVCDEIRWKKLLYR